MAIFAVTTKKGPSWDDGLGIRDQAGWDQHAAFVDDLAARGVVIMGGPIDGGDADAVALLAVDAPDDAQLRSIFAEDPWAHSGVLGLKAVQRWTLWIGAKART